MKHFLKKVWAWVISIILVPVIILFCVARGVSSVCRSISEFALCELAPPLEPNESCSNWLSHLYDTMLDED